MQTFKDYLVESSSKIIARIVTELSTVKITKEEKLQGTELILGKPHEGYRIWVDSRGLEVLVQQGNKEVKHFGSKDIKSESYLDDLIDMFY